MNIDNFIEYQQKQGKVNTPYLEYFNQNLYQYNPNPVQPSNYAVDEEENILPVPQSNIGYPKIVDLDSDTMYKKRSIARSKEHMPTSNCKLTFNRGCNKKRYSK